MITNRLGWNTLFNGRSDLRLITLFKIVHHLVDINLQDIVVPRPPSHDTRGHHLQLFQNHTRVNAFPHT